MSDRIAAIRKLTKRQQEVLGMVMICQDAGQNPKILDRLAGLGLCEKEEQLMHFRDGLPPMNVPRYFMTYEQNYAYCCWAKEQGEGEEP